MPCQDGYGDVHAFRDGVFVNLSCRVSFVLCAAGIDSTQRGECHRGGGRPTRRIANQPSTVCREKMSSEFPDGCIVW
jgi:hypothetical protein